MCDKAILENGETLKSVPDWCKNQEMCNKAVDNCSHALEFVPECYKTRKICDEVADTHPSTIEYVSDCCKTQECVMKQFIDVSLYPILFLINMKLKKYLT